MIDTEVYQRISEDTALAAIVGDRIEPVLPQVDSPLPYLYYWRLDSQENLTLDGPTTPKSYTFAFDFWSLTQADIRQISDAIYASLSTWREDGVRGAFRQTDGSEETERGYHGQSTYQIWI